MKNLRGPQRNKNVVVQNRERERAASRTGRVRPLAGARGSVSSRQFVDFRNGLDHRVA